MKCVGWIIRKGMFPPIYCTVVTGVIAGMSYLLHAPVSIFFWLFAVFFSSYYSTKVVNLNA